MVTKNVESQLQTYHKVVTKMIFEQPMDISDHTSATSPIFVESVQHIAFSLATVQREKEKRKLSIIVHNLKESASTDSSVRKQDDINEYKCLLETYIYIYIYIYIYTWASLYQLLMYSVWEKNQKSFIY